MARAWAFRSGGSSALSSVAYSASSSLREIIRSLRCDDVGQSGGEEFATAHPEARREGVGGCKELIVDGDDSSHLPEIS
jgi:hypothetical protein